MGARAAEPALPQPKALLADAASWAYQLQDARARDLARTAYDVLVLDAFYGGDRTELEKLRAKPFGGRRLLLASLSVGAAEVYRYYWRDCCKGRERPEWLLGEDPRWRGNFRVRFGHADWKAIVFAGDDSYLKRIVEAGFDGVVLDRLDAYRDAGAAGGDGKADMIRFVAELSEAARKMKPGFLVLAQNAEELLDEPAMLAAVDGAAKEDLLYGAGSGAGRNAKAATEASIGRLRRLTEAGKPVLVVEYVEDPAVVAATRAELQELGFVPYFASRSLASLKTENLEDEDTH